MRRPRKSLWAQAHRRFESSTLRQILRSKIRPEPPLLIFHAARGTVLFMKNHEYYMREALKEAVKAFENDEVPVGAIIVHKGEIIGRAHNQIKTLKDPTAHAEIIAITQAANFLQNERLVDCVMYSTLEPCSMCAGAMVLSRIESLVYAAKDLLYAAKDPKTGAHDSVFKILNNKKLNHRIKVKKGILENEASSLMKEFFYGKRKSKT